ncbi:MAG: DUF1674 domain-containing protein [Rhodospirillales bacterium]|nr:DUF1674 domain-containing protein [Rhodospirillales bacterium]
MEPRAPIPVSSDSIEGGKTSVAIPAILVEADQAPPPSAPEPAATTEIGGPRGKEPTRYGDWEKNGRCIDF